ncbi:MAG TPA: DUF2378 family protein, partial [Myxococcales bacterium]|nr:DUF2378 family protein [Myxococcales bacterium]
EAVLDRFREHGVDLAGKLKVAYPYQSWIASLRVAADLLAPGQPMEEATYVIGRRILESYAETMVGKATFGFLKVIGPRRGFDQLRRSLRTGNNYAQTSFAEVSPGVFQLWVGPVTFPHYYRGLLEAGLEVIGRKDGVVKLIRHDEAGATFEVRWSE